MNELYIYQPHQHTHCLLPLSADRFEELCCFSFFHSLRVFFCFCLYVCGAHVHFLHGLASTKHQPTNQPTTHTQPLACAMEEYQQQVSVCVDVVQRSSYSPDKLNLLKRFIDDFRRLQTTEEASCSGDVSTCVLSAAREGQKTTHLSSRVNV